MIWSPGLWPLAVLDPSLMSIRRFRATVEYDGTDFSGFQRQAQGERTVQETLEDAIRVVTGQAATVLGAGRTDAGVHATGQVIAFDVGWRHDEATLGRALNANLAPDVAVRKVKLVEEDFHPRFDARRRTYQYRINNQRDPSPLQRRATWHRPHVLDVAAMKQASALLIGEHDFATFGRPPTGANTVRRVWNAEWQRHGEQIIFTIEANAFLYRMVRSLVGSLCLVGEKRWSVTDFSRAFSATDRASAGPLAPPQGLCMLSVTF